MDVDDEELQTLVRRGEVVIGDQDLALLRRTNRIGLALGAVTHLGGGPGLERTTCYDVPLLCVVHPSSGCHFRSAKLMVDLRVTPGASVRDMAPREVRGDRPVELTTTVGTGLTFTVVPSLLGLEARREQVTSRTIYQPTIVTSGKGFARAFWEFRSNPGDRLQPDRELRLLAESPAGAPLLARFNLSATVALDGARQVIPLLRRRADIDQTYQLA
jgi:hypothetical protein